MGDSQYDKPQGGHPKRTELQEVHLNTGAQSINSESFLKDTCRWLHEHN